MIGFVSTVLPEVRLDAVVREAQPPPGWTTAVLDRQLTPIAWSGADADAPLRDLPPGLRDRVLRSPDHGHFMAPAGGQDMLVAVHRSTATDYTTVTMVPGALANAPLNAALWNIGSAGVVLLLAGALAGLVLVRQVGPVEISAALTARRLQLAEARYRSLWFDTPESLFIVTVNEDGRFVFEGLNPAHERATGLTFEAVAGKEPEACLPPAAAAAVLERYRHCVATGRPEIYDEVLDLPSGRRYWQTSLSPVRDPDTGRIVLLVGTARDVTRDREARARIEQSQRLLQATLDALSAHIAILDGTGTIVAVNRAWNRFAEEGGYLAPDHGIGRNYLQVCKEAAASDRQVARVVDGLTSVLGGDSEVFKAGYQCGSRSFQMSMARFCGAGAAHIVVAHEDVSDLRSAQQDVRDIADRLLSLQEEERRRIAADLHDSTAQHIVAAGLGLMNVSAVARAAPGAEQAIGTVRASLDEAHKEIRTLSYLLYPPDLSRHGLAASLRRFVEGFYAPHRPQGTGDRNPGGRPAADRGAAHGAPGRSGGAGECAPACSGHEGRRQGATRRDEPAAPGQRQRPGARGDRVPQRTDPRCRHSRHAGPHPPVRRRSRHRQQRPRHDGAGEHPAPRAGKLRPAVLPDTVSGFVLMVAFETVR